MPRSPRSGPLHPRSSRRALDRVRPTADAQSDHANGPQGHDRQHLRAAAAAAARDRGRGRRELPAARRAAERRVRRGPAGREQLKEKYAGDTKRLLKIDVAKDKIAELSCRQRVSGTFGVTAEVAKRATRRSATSRRP